jgi:SNF2 family DNA or RNA helicase
MFAIDMGMGKTITALTAAKILLEIGEVDKVLIVGPKRVAQFTWPDEFTEWEHTKDLDFTVVTGDLSDTPYIPVKGEPKPTARQKAADSSAPIHITNRENLVWLWKHFGEGRNWPYDMLIYDESSRLKGFLRRSKRDKKTGKGGNINEFGVLMKARRNFFRRVIELSGTPSPNGLRDLGGQICLLDEGERLGHCKSVFEKRFFKKCPYTYEYTPKPHAFKEITESISDICVSLRTEDYVEMPQIVSLTKKVKLSKKQMKMYKELEKTLVLEEFDLEVANQAACTQKLLQLSNGSMYKTQMSVDEYERIVEDREVIEIHDEKIHCLESIVEEACGKPILLAYSFQFDKDRILKAFPNAVVFEEDDTAYPRWNKGEIDLLIAHPASIGHGLNLQKGSNIAVWYGLNWSLELYLQFNKRLARPGQPDEKVFLYHIITEGTHDERILPSLREKNCEQDDILKAIEVPKELVKQSNIL